MSKEQFLVMQLKHGVIFFLFYASCGQILNTKFCERKSLPWTKKVTVGRRLSTFMHVAKQIVVVVTEL